MRGRFTARRTAPFIDLSFYDDMKSWARTVILLEGCNHRPRSRPPCKNCWVLRAKVRQLRGRNASQTEGESPFSAHGATGGLLYGVWGRGNAAAECWRRAIWKKALNAAQAGGDDRLQQGFGRVVRIVYPRHLRTALLAWFKRG